MKIQVVSAQGNGQVKFVDVAQPLTVAELFASQFPAEDILLYLVRVNRHSATPEQVLRDGDRVTITPLGIEGAGA